MVAGLYPRSNRAQSVGRCSPRSASGNNSGQENGMEDREHADEILRRALLDSEATAAVALRVSGLPLCEELTVVFHGRRDLGTIQTYVTNGGHGDRLGGLARRAAARAVRARPRRGRGSRGGRAPLRRAGRRAAGCARRRRHGARHLARAAGGARRQPRRGRSPDRPRARPAGAASAARRAGGSRPPDRGHRRLRCPAARRGPPADGHRVRAAGRRARVPAPRRPGALPRGLPRARRRPRPPDGRAARPPGGQRPALPRAVRRRLPRKPAEYPHAP